MFYNHFKLVIVVQVKIVAGLWRLRSGPIPINVVKGMIRKFKEILSLNVSLRRGRCTTQPVMVEEVAFATDEAFASSLDIPCAHNCMQDSEVLLLKDGFRGAIETARSFFGLDFALNFPERMRVNEY